MLFHGHMRENITASTSYDSYKNYIHINLLLSAYMTLVNWDYILTHNSIFCVIWLDQISLMLFCWGFIFARKDYKCFIIDFINPINLLWSKISANFLYKAFSILKNYNIMRIFLLLRKYAIHIVMIDEGCNPILVYVIEPGAMS